MQSKIFISFSSRLLLPLLMGTIIFSQYYSDKESGTRPLIPPTIIPASAIRLADLGLDSAASVIMWIYTIQNIPEKMPELINITNDLDPKFSYPYAFASLLMPGFGFTEEAEKISQRGLKEADPDWRIPYYMATNYHIFLHDVKNAAFYFGVVADTPGTPENVRTIAARYGTAENTLQQTKQIWISIYENSRDEVVRERAKNFIIHVEIVELLEKAVAIYEKKYGFPPKTLGDLVTKKILKEIPQSPLGVSFEIRSGKIAIVSASETLPR